MANRILLTGAGFTHNFGTPLASGVSNLIFNSISDNTQLIDLLRNNFDYEDVYQNVMQSNDYDIDTKNTLTHALRAAYDIINELVENNDLSGINTNNFKQLIHQFFKPNGSGFIFTLNQDLFIEKNIVKFPETMLYEAPAPGNSIKNDQYPFNHIRLDISYNDFDKYKTEKQRSFDKPDPRLFYIKLHGSQDWFKDNTNPIMVIGHGKSERIAVEPLLNWYFDIFNNQLSKNDTKLLIIGYSFRDEHINQVIYNYRNNINIYIIDTQSFENFSNDLNNKPFGSEIKKLIKKYYSVNLIELFGTTIKNPHPFWNQLQYEFFDNQYYKNK